MLVRMRKTPLWYAERHQYARKRRGSFCVDVPQLAKGVVHRLVHGFIWDHRPLVQGSSEEDRTGAS